MDDNDEFDHVVHPEDLNIMGYQNIQGIGHADVQCPGGTFSKWTVSKNYLLAVY